MAPVEPEEDACGVEDDGVDDADDDVRYAIAIEVFRAEVETARVEVADHPAEDLPVVKSDTTGREDEGQDCSRRCERMGKGLH